MRENLLGRGQIRMLNRAKDLTKRFFAFREAARQEKRTKYFDGWNSELDETLAVLSENELCTHDLFLLRMKMDNPEKRIMILMTEKRVSVALVGHRNRWG